MSALNGSNKGYMFSLEEWNAKDVVNKRIFLITTYNLMFGEETNKILDPVLNGHEIDEHGELSYDLQMALNTVKYREYLADLDKVPSFIRPFVGSFRPLVYANIGKVWEYHANVIKRHQEMHKSSVQDNSSREAEVQEKTVKRREVKSTTQELLDQLEEIEQQEIYYMDVDVSSNKKVPQNDEGKNEDVKPQLKVINLASKVFNDFDSATKQAETVTQITAQTAPPKVRTKVIQSSNIQIEIQSKQKNVLEDFTPVIGEDETYDQEIVNRENDPFIDSFPWGVENLNSQTGKDILPDHLKTVEDYINLYQAIYKIALEENDSGVLFAAIIIIAAIINSFEFDPGPRKSRYMEFVTGFSNPYRIDMEWKIQTSQITYKYAREKAEEVIKANLLKVKNHIMSSKSWR